MMAMMELSLSNSVIFLTNGSSTFYRFTADRLEYFIQIVVIFYLAFNFIGGDGEGKPMRCLSLIQPKLEVTLRAGERM